MSPQVKKFKPGSIIYFEKDKADSVFLLKEGKVNLIYDDIQIGEKVIDQITTGEFFGVKSGLIRCPREETAKVVTDSIVFEFSAQEFEILIMKNTKIILKMLKAFSNQLRKVGKQVQGLVSNRVASEPADDFFHIGEYYLKNKKYKQAMTVYQRYIHYYPGGKYATLAKKRHELAKNSLDSYGDGGGPAPSMEDEDSDDFENFDESPFIESSDVEDIDNDFGFDSGMDNNNKSEGGKIYYKGVSFMSQGKYLDAFNTFKKVLNVGTEEERVLASYEIGKSLFFLNKFKECINHYSSFLSKHPDYVEKNEILFYIGSSFSKIGDNTKAEKYFNNIISSTNQSDKIYRKAQKALRELV